VFIGVITIIYLDY